jgi:aminoglycoside phosphotransferase (APT) family kinase protein
MSTMQTRQSAPLANAPATEVDDSLVRAGLGEHLSRAAGGQVAITAFDRLSPGFSWLTYSFKARYPSGESRQLILRLGPPSGLFAPYSVLPQVYALKALAGTSIPVPGLVAHAEHGDAVGFPFFVCEHVRGHVTAPWTGSSAGEEHRLRIAEQFVDILADLHRVDWAASALAELPSPDAAEGRMELRPISGWRRLIARPMQRSYPLLDWAGHWLTENCPKPPHLTAVHGDYRVGNFLEDEGRITAILDWELTHIGDPHEDLGWALMPTFNAGSRKLYGVMAREQVLERYTRRSGIPIALKSLAFYEAFALYQAAGIQLCGAYAFEVDRCNDMRMAAMATRMAPIIRALDRAIEAAA